MDEGGMIVMIYRTKENGRAFRKAVVYFLLLLSLFFFGRGWITFSSSVSRKEYARTAETVLSNFKHVSSSERELIADNLQRRGLDVSPDTLIRKMKGVCNALKDGKVSPKDFRVITGHARWLCKMEAESEYSQNAEEAEEYMKSIGLYSTISNILYFGIMIMFVTSIVVLIRRIRISILGYCVFSFLHLVFFIFVRIKSASEVEKFLDLFSFIGFNNSGVDTSLKLCFPMFLSFICAVAACICWKRLLILSDLEEAEIPALHILRKNSRTREKSKVRSKNESYKSCPACGMVMEENDKFCPCCGMKFQVQTSVNIIPDDMVSISKERDHLSSSKDPVTKNPSHSMTDERTDRSYCIFCGKELLKDALFCGNCGRRIDEMRVEQEEGQNDLNNPADEFDDPEELHDSEELYDTEELNDPEVLDDTEVHDDDKTIFMPDLSKELNTAKEIVFTDLEDSTVTYSISLGKDTPIKVGRGREEDLKITHNQSVSRRHCTLYMEGDKIFVQDAGSSYGTFVDDRKVEKDQSIELNDGCILTLGNCRLQVQIAE